MYDETDFLVVWVVENDFISVWWIGIDLVFMQRPKMTCSCRIEINWVFVSGHRNGLDVRVGIEIHSISVMGSNLTWFLRAGSKSTWF